MDTPPDNRPESWVYRPPAEPRLPLYGPRLQSLLFLAHTPFGGRVHAVYDRARELVNDALKRIQGQHPGGKVTKEVEDIGQAVQTQAAPGLVTPTAKTIRRTTADVIKDTNATHVANYAALDTTYRQYPAEWGASQPRLPAVTKPEDLLTDPALMVTYQIGPASIFHQTAQAIEAMRNLPPTIAVDTLIDMQKTVNTLILEGQKHIDEALALQKTDPTRWTELTTSIQKNVLPALADTNALLYQHLRPYMVDRGPAQETAKKVIGAWQESLKTPESAMQKGGPGRVGVLEDPQVMAARAFIDKPRYALFTEAHNDRSQWLKISRVPGPNLGNDIAREAGEVATALDRSMTRTGEYATGGAHAPGHQLEALRRSADAAYKADAEVLNSPLMMELADKNLDDIITTFVQPGRVNDMKTLRATLGDQAMDDAAQMWLTKQLDKHTPASTRVRLPTDPPLGPATGPGQLNNQGLLADLDKLDPETTKVLFPHGNLTGIRNRLRQGIDMEAALAEVGKETPNLTVLQQLKTRINDPQLWSAVQSDALHPYLKGDVDGLKGATLLDGLEKMGKARDILFEPAHLKDLQHLAHTSRALDQTARAWRLSWSPLVRFIEHGVIVAGLHWMTGGWIAPAGYLIATPVLARMLTTPAIVRRLTRGLLSKDVVPILLQAAPAGQERVQGP